jgi:hypothetical protein
MRREDNPRIEKSKVKCVRLSAWEIVAGDRSNSVAVCDVDTPRPEQLWLVESVESE